MFTKYSPPDGTLNLSLKIGTNGGSSFCEHDEDSDDDGNSVIRGIDELEKLADEESDDEFVESKGADATGDGVGGGGGGGVHPRE